MIGDNNISYTQKLNVLAGILEKKIVGVFLQMYES